MSGYSGTDILWMVVIVVLIVGSIILHEIGHGYAAYKLGDPTAKSQGRLTLNPLKHIDSFGSVILPLILVFSGGPVIGYAKPVPYNPRYFKNLRVGELVVGLAGPFTNIALALIAAAIAALVYRFAPWTAVTAGVWQVLAQLVLVNLALAFFNLIPLPPLDGSSIIALFLSDKALPKYYSVQRYALPILIAVLVIVPWITGVNPIGWYIQHTAYALGYALLGL